MKVFAYVSIIEVVLKLLIVYILVIFSFDKLKLYAFLILVITCIVTSIYRIICKRKYEECRFSFYWDKELFNTLASFSGWNLFGATSSVFNNQGINILLNIFFGPVINAARGIAFQISTYVNQFARSFITAVDPQITKYYASEKKEQMMTLVFRSSKVSYFLMLILTMPILLEAHFILSIWLKQVPDYTFIFTVLIITIALIDSLSYPLMTAAQATGDIKKYQLIVGGALLLNLPISYLFLRLNYPPQTTLYISIIISLICLILRLLMLRTMINLSLRNYIKNVLQNVVFTTCPAFILPICIIKYFPESFCRFVIVGLCRFDLIHDFYLFIWPFNKRT